MSGFTNTQLTQLKNLFQEQEERLEQKLDERLNEKFNIFEQGIYHELRESEKRQQQRHDYLTAIVENAIDISDTNRNEITIAGGQIDQHEKDIKKLDKRVSKLELQTA